MTRSLKATSAGKIALNHLTSNTNGQVCAVFASVFYIQCPTGLLAFAHQSTSPGPLTVITDHAPADWQKRGLTVGKSAHVSDGKLALPGQLSIDFANVKPWHPPVPTGPIDPAKGLHLLHSAKLNIPKTGYAPLIHDQTQTAPDDLSAFLGRGPGLTPAGDDLIGGAFITLNAIGQAARARDIWTALKPHARVKTNPISYALLSAAAQGMGNAEFHAALNAVLTPSTPHDLTQALAGLAKIGHSSGWDAFAGAVLTLRAHVQHAA